MAEDNGSRLRDAELGGVAGLILRIHYIIALFFLLRPGFLMGPRELYGRAVISL